MKGSSLGGQWLRLRLPDVCTHVRSALPALHEELLAFPINKGALMLQRDPSGRAHRQAAGARVRKAGAWVSAQGFPEFLLPKAGCRVCQGDF